MAAKLLRVAKERFLEKQIQHRETFAQNAYLSETSKIIIASTEGTNEGANRPLEQLARQTETTFNRSAQSAAVSPTGINEVVNCEHFRQPAELEVNWMQREFELCANVCSARNALNVTKFLTDIREGPYYIGVCCNRMLYRKTVRKFYRNAYTIDMFTDVHSFHNKEYICNTCHAKATKGKIPCQAVCNKLQIDEVPSELEALRKL